MAACGYTCLTGAYHIAEASCEYNAVCVCSDSTYVNSFYACLNEYCDASDFELWTKDAISACSYYGVTWPSSAPSPQSTGAQTFAPGPASTVTVSAEISSAFVAAPSTVTLFSAVTSSNPLGQSSVASINLPTSGPTTTLFPAVPTASPDSQPTNNGLSSGAIAGISVGVAAIFFLAVLAFLLWHRNRRQKESGPTVVAPNEEGHVTDSIPFEKDSKAIATVSTIDPYKHPSGIPSEPLQPDPNYKLTVSSVDPRYQPPLSPSPAYTEIAGTPAAAEADTSKSYQLPVDNPVARPGYIEADSTPLSHNITSPATELEDPSFAIHELPIEPPLHAQPATGTSAQELASSSAAQLPATVLGEEGQRGAGQEAAEDPELARMKTEIEQLRAEKEREMRLLSMEARERELSQKIVQMELRASSGGAGGSGSGSGSGGGS